MAFLRPSRREDFEIVIICALRLEYDAVSYVFDEYWDDDGDKYGRAEGDRNSYTTGRIGKYNVVLVLLSHMGKASAASAAASIRSSFARLQLGLLVGICGGVPRPGSDADEILLGDVVISKAVVQYDFGKQYPNKFVRKDTVEDNLGKPNKDVRNLIATFETDRGRDRLRERVAYFLQELQANAARRRRGDKYKYPGTVQDELFNSSYRHKHQVSPACVCSDCHGRFDPICDEAVNSSCDDLKCDKRYLVARGQLQIRRKLETDDKSKAQEPTIHIGAIASGDTVMKSGDVRDRIAQEEDVIAYEMEGAGIWEEVPCIVIKGICDYADCHKNKIWQNFAAATAASASKAVLERYTQTDKVTGETRFGKSDIVGMRSDDISNSSVSESRHAGRPSD